ncbi:MAG: hypothetical protein JWO82_216 [Akkermansiaceae bacterium]|nr:hypothetical protein [Akkermansiaceae bacterium]
MKELELEFGDFSGHPAPPQIDLGAYENWILDRAHGERRAKMTTQDMIADFMRNEGRQTEEWPDFGASL